MLCSDCNKNLAVIFMTKMENNKIAEVCNQGVNGTYISFY